jgi:hypothetical protein
MRVVTLRLAVFSLAVALAGFLAGNALASKQICDPNSQTSCPSSFTCAPGTSCPAGTTACVSGGGVPPLRKTCDSSGNGCTPNTNCTGVCAAAPPGFSCSCPVAPADAC